MSGKIIGVDVGGTFTDVFILDPTTGSAETRSPPRGPINRAAFWTGLPRRSRIFPRFRWWCMARLRARTPCWNARAQKSA